MLDGPRHDVYYIQELATWSTLTTSIVLISQEHIKRGTQRRDRMKGKEIEAKLSEGQENAGQVVFNTKGGSGVTKVQGK